MVNIQQYKILNEGSQLHLLNTEAVLLMTRKTVRMNMKLYSLYDFYVEIFYDKGEDDPLYVKAIDAASIDPYLDNIMVKRCEHTHNL